jgi:hypothetical protein
MIASAPVRNLRVLLTVAVTLQAVACGGDATGNPAQTPPAGVSTVIVTPATAALPLGDTLTLSASARDASGAVLSGKTVTWSSSATSVATVSAAGLVKAVAIGSASISATVDGKSAAVPITITGRVALETAQAASATISDTGGTLSATSAEGVTYKLVVPKLALDSAVRITMTPIGRIGALPFSGGLLGGVDFQPSGLKFGPKTQLIITPKSPVPALGPNQRLVGFTFERSVDTSAIQPASVRGGGFAITIEHFSSGGLAIGNVADLSTLPPVPNGSIQQQRLAQLAVLVMPQDRSAAIALFKAWRTQIETLIATAQTGTDAKVAVDLFLNWTETAESTSQLIGLGTADALFDAAIAPDRAALVLATQAALQRGIAQLNQQCITFRNLLDAQNVLYLRAYAEIFSNNELTANGSGLTLNAQLLTLCVQPIQSFVSFPNTFTANSSVALDLTYGVKFGNNTAAQGAFFDVTLTVTGAASNGTSTFQTDAGGRTLPHQIATGTTPITVAVKSCLASSQVGLSAVMIQLRDVCHFSTFQANPPEVLSVAGVLQTATPASLFGDALENSAARLIRESQATLPNQVVADIVNPGSYLASLSVGFIPAGTPVISYIVHADPIGQPTNDQIFSGSVTFLRDILGIISTAGSLDATDALLGAAGTAYPTGDAFRDAGVGPGSTDADQIQLSTDRRTLTFIMQLKHFGQIRVILKQ